MRRSFQWTLILGALLALTLGIAACGGDDDDDSEPGTTQGTPAEGKKGGTLTALWTDDVDFIDPGITYYQMGFRSLPRPRRPSTATSPTTPSTPCRTSPRPHPRSPRTARPSR